MTKHGYKMITIQHGNSIYPLIVGGSTYKKLKRGLENIMHLSPKEMVYTFALINQLGKNPEVQKALSLGFEYIKQQRDLELAALNAELNKAVNDYKLGKISQYEAQGKEERLKRKHDEIIIKYREKYGMDGQTLSGQGLYFGKSIYETKLPNDVGYNDPVKNEVSNSEGNVGMTVDNAIGILPSN
jgi:hypothetical protein